ncbi:hypothetical protein F5Y09DRAFT_322816 [Xylaria sp. FL1042]|nr:hypothetical protein F5Y09DRAFT_322816 [Xylaria sp. FL1042]
MGVFHGSMPPPSSILACRHSCGCPSTNHSLPKLISFFRAYGHEATSYSSSTHIPKDLGLESSCPQCQLKTESGVEMAISAMHCGPDSLVNHAFVRAMFISLIDLRLQHEEEMNTNDDDYDSGSESEVTPTADWDWENIWYEFIKAFELRRDRVDAIELLLDLSEREGLQYQDWWCAVLQRLGVEALLTFEVYVSEGLVVRPEPTDLSALKRDVKLIQSIEDLVDVYVDLDRRVHVVVQAHKILPVSRFYGNYSGGMK